MVAPIGAKVKSAFFDRKAVIDAVGKVEAKNISKGLAFIRQTDRRSMRSRKKSSAPGSPPSAHSAADRTKKGLVPRGPWLKEGIVFGFDFSSRSGVVGPQQLPGSKSNAPEIQEFGGPIVVRKFIRKPGRKGKKLNATQRANLKRLRREGRIKPSPSVKTTIILPARPSARPAAETEARKGSLVGVWADSVK